MARPQSKRETVSTGVVLDVHVKKCLDDLANEDQRDRSFMINKIVREWAKGKGIEIPLSPKERRV